MFLPTLWNLARFLIVYCPESLPLSEFLFLTSWLLPAPLLSAVALSLFYFLHLCPSVTISIWSSDCILHPKCWFQFENIWFLWIKDKYGRENCYDNARLISWILLFFVGPWLSLKFEGALMYYLHSSPKGCCQSFELILNKVDMYSPLIKIWNVDIRKIHSVLIIYNFYESWEGKNPTF